MRNFLLSFLLMSTSLTGFCTVWTINDLGLTYTPASITISLGDTINFALATSHNAREVSQATWNANGTTALAGGFQAPFGGGMILPAQLGVGTHYYVCTPHASFGMKGTIIVQSCSSPATPLAISGSANVCPASANTYSVTAVSGATSYTWTLPGGWAGTSTTNSITTTAGATSGNITVSANNACGSSSVRTLAVSVTPAPATPGAITGNAALCPASANTYSVAAVSGATSYTWTLPGGWSGTSTTNSITTTAGATSGNITVSANNACGSSASQTLAVAVTPAPATPGAITGNAAVCPAGANTYSVAETPGATSYTWTLPGGWTGTSTTNSITTTAGATSGNITVSANNACGSSAVRTLALTVTVVDTAVSQSGITLTATAAGATYQWINCTSNALLSGQTNQSYTAAENGTYAVIVTQNGCSDTSACLAVTTVGIEDDGALSSILLYPNPSNGHFQFSIHGSQMAQGGKLEIYTVEGKRIYQSIITQTISDVDLSHQATGIYFVKFDAGQAILTTKILLE